MPIVVKVAEKLSGQFPWKFSEPSWDATLSVMRKQLVLPGVGLYTSSMSETNNIQELLVVPADQRNPDWEQNFLQASKHVTSTKLYMRKSRIILLNTQCSSRL